MKRTLFVFIIICSVFSAHAQSIIAHWNMNGSTNDTSGNGNNGMGYNLTPAAGIDGVMGHAWYFNGSNSYISVPYAPILNTNTYSIAVVIKVMGFNSGTCQANTILERGDALNASPTGSYGMSFDDNCADSSCSIFDSTLDVFHADGHAACNPSFLGESFYTPCIVENVWYKVVVTYDDTVRKLYINDTLKLVNPTAVGCAIGSSTDGISIGMATYGGGSYPYPFKGVIDDIQIYSSVLTDSQVVHLYDTCGSITLEPSNTPPSGDGVISYTMATNITGATYQWQQNAGTGFLNLSNVAPYSGVTTPTLTITGVTASMNNYLYRCLVSNSRGCADTTTSTLLTTEVKNILTDDMVSIYPNPTKTTLFVRLPKTNYTGTLQLLNEIGQLIEERDIAGQTTGVDMSNLPEGVYLIKINADGQMIYKKTLKM